MRTVIYGLLLVVCVGNFMLSCNKQEESNSGVLENFTKLKNSTEQRLAFNLLTTNEKVVLISAHIDFCLSFFDLTSSQKIVLTEVRKNLPSFFKNKSQEENEELLLLEIQVSKHFSTMDSHTKELIFSTMVLSEADVDNWQGLPTVPPYSSNCACSTSSDYCNRSSSGTKCLKGGCNASNLGCGTLWAYGCGGLCFTVMVG